MKEAPQRTCPQHKHDEERHQGNSVRHPAIARRLHAPHIEHAQGCNAGLHSGDNNDYRPKVPGLGGIAGACMHAHHAGHEAHGDSQGGSHNVDS